MQHYFNFGEYSYLNSEFVDSDNTNYNSTSVTFRYPCTNSQNCSGFEIKLNPGKYLFEVFGARGSDMSCAPLPSGYGGYGRAEVIIPNKIPIYLYVGSSGEWNSNGPSPPSFNGGGPGFNAGSGGGATDFRMSKNDTHTRFLIGGGGGGWGHIGEKCSKKLHEIITYPYGYNYGGGENGANASGSTGGTQYGPGMGFRSGSFGSGCELHTLGRHGGSGGGLYGGGCDRDSGVDGAGGSVFVYSDHRTPDIYEIKSIKISNGTLISGRNLENGYAIISLLSLFTDIPNKRFCLSQISCKNFGLLASPLLTIIHLLRR